MTKGPEWDTRLCVWGTLLQRPQRFNAAGSLIVEETKVLVYRITLQLGKGLSEYTNHLQNMLAKMDWAENQPTLICGCWEDFFWIGAQSLLFRVIIVLVCVLTTGEFRPADGCSSVMPCLLFLGAELYKHGTVWRHLLSCWLWKWFQLQLTACHPAADDVSLFSEVK